MIALSLVAVWVAMDPGSKVLDVVPYAWAIAGVVVGGLTVVIWGEVSGGIFDIYELLPGFIFSTAAIVIVSAVTKCPAAVVSRHRELLGVIPADCCLDSA